MHLIACIFKDYFEPLYQYEKGEERVKWPRFLWSESDNFHRMMITTDKGDEMKIESRATFVCEALKGPKSQRVFGVTKTRKNDSWLEQ